MKFCNKFDLSNLEIVVKEQCFRISRSLQLEKWLFGPKMFLELSRNGPQGTFLCFNQYFCFPTEFGHIVEIYNISPDMKTQDIMQALSCFRLHFVIFLVNNQPNNKMKSLCLLASLMFAFSLFNLPSLCSILNHS